MKIFISWSGSPSKEVGEILREYLPMIIQEAEVFLSEHDISSGARWVESISTELEQTHYGIMCLSSNNLDSKWLLFEAGALSKFKDSHLSGVLIGQLKPTDVESPLSQFQHRRFEKDDLKKLFLDINEKLNKPRGVEMISKLFEMCWDEISNKYNAAVGNLQFADSNNIRSDRELLEEILYIVRETGTKEVTVELSTNIAKDLPKFRSGLLKFDDDDIKFVNDLLKKSKKNKEIE